MKNEDAPLNKNILVAVDDSDNSRRAVQYVGYLLGNLKGVHVTLLHVIPEPDEDYFPEDMQKQQWLKKYHKKLDAILDEYKRMLVADGFMEGLVE